jgi:hypothetical protein
LPLQVTSQSLFLVDDNKYAIVYLQSHMKIGIRTKFLDNSERINDNLFEFYLGGDTIKQKWLSIGQEDFEINYDSKKDTNYQHYPYYIPIKNNSHKISTNIGDSLVLDSIGRIRDVYNNLLETKIHFRQTYFTHNLSLRSEECLSCKKGEYKRNVSLIKTDKHQNIVYVKVGIADSLFSIDFPDTSKANFYELTIFNYSKARKRITSIQHFDINKGIVRLIETQFFKYKRGKPVSSYERKEKTGKIEYQQTYTYSSAIPKGR